MLININHAIKLSHACLAYDINILDIEHLEDFNNWLGIGDIVLLMAGKFRSFKTCEND